MLDVCLLGTGGMMPLPDRWLTSLLLRYNGNMFLIDCGEGTQIPLKQAGWGFKSISTIFFTHFHADHIAGLPGLLLTIGNSGKETPLDLIGPPGLLHIAQSLLVICQQLPYEIRAVELPLLKQDTDGEGCISPMHSISLCDDLTFSYTQAVHSAPCVSYGFQIRRKGVFLPDRARELNVPVKLWRVLQDGGNVASDDGKNISPDMVMGKERKGIKLCYCTDSRPAARLVKLFLGSDLLICEGLYGDDADQAGASAKKHMVFSEAAKLAAEANVGELWLTHFSPAMRDPARHINSAKNIFGNSIPGRDLQKKTISFTD